MATPAQLERRVGGFHRTSVFVPVVVLTVAVTAAAAFAETPGSVSVAVVVAVVAALGIPHGAVDHLAAAALGGPFDTSSPRRFARDYLLAMLGVGVLWLLAPTVALAGFLVVSVHHFGQSDLAYLGLPPGRAIAVQWSRGLLLIGLPLVAHLEAVGPVIERLGGGDPASWAWLADRWIPWSAVLVAQHVAIGWALTHRDIDRPTLAREAVTAAALTALFLTADPLIGFAVYFGLWHSIAHLFVLGDLIGAGSTPIRSVIGLAAPLTAVSLIGIAVVVGGAVATDRTDLIVPLTFVFVSMLTVPHLFVVERIWGTGDAASAPAQDESPTPTTGTPTRSPTGGGPS